MAKPPTDVFVPPPNLARASLPPRHLDSTQDLLGRFGLTPAYDAYVRPYVRPLNDKGKAKDTTEGTDGVSNRIPHGLKTFLGDLPGKTSTKKSESITDLMMAAPKQRMEIATFDARTLEFFRLPEGQLQPSKPNQFGQGADVRKKKKSREDGGMPPAA